MLYRLLNCGFSHLTSLLCDKAVKRDPGSRQDTGQAIGGPNSRRARSCRVLAVTILMVMAGAQAEEAEPEYDIYLPERDAASALEQLAEQTGAITLFPFDLAAARTANAVIGRFTLPDALELLLKDTGVSGGLFEKRVISITATAAAERTEENIPENLEISAMETSRNNGVLAAVLSFLVGAGGAQ